MAPFSFPVSGGGGGRGARPGTKCASLIIYIAPSFLPPPLTLSSIHIPRVLRIGGACRLSVFPHLVLRRHLTSPPPSPHSTVAALLLCRRPAPPSQSSSHSVVAAAPPWSIIVVSSTLLIVRLAATCSPTAPRFVDASPSSTSSASPPSSASLTSLPRCLSRPAPPKRT